MADKPAASSKAKPKAKAPNRADNDQIRLHVRIAHSGICSRRAAEQLIADGRVQVNGQYVREMGVLLKPDDEVRVDGVKLHTPKIYTVVLNKPTGVLTTLADPRRRKTIVSFLPDFGVQLKPVGRLDMDTEGLLICTNDGELAQRLAHPSHGIEKEYLATVKGVPDEAALEKLRKGVFVDGARTAPAEAAISYKDPNERMAALRIVLHEGRKRQVRLMCQTVGHPVMSLKRIRVGPLLVKGMRPGECRLLGKKEVDSLRKLVGLPIDEE